MVMLTGRSLRPFALALVLGSVVFLPHNPLPVRADQNTSSVRFSYDANGNLKTQTALDGTTVAYDYDVMDRVTAVRYPDGSATTYSFDALGRRTSVTNTTGTTSYTYDIHGRVTAVEDPNGHTVRYNYDPRGLLTHMTYPDKGGVDYIWDANGQLTGVRDETGETRYERDATGRVTRRVLPNGITSHYAYDVANHIASISHSDSDGALLLGFAYTYNAVDNLTGETRTEAGSVPQETRYIYDVTYRLIGVTYPDGERVTYTYDAAGNRIAMTSSTSGTTRYAYRDGRLVRLNGPDGNETFRYDAIGNLIEKETEDGIVRYTWNYDGRLTRLEDEDEVVELFYDGDGTLLRKKVGERWEEYVYNYLGSTPEMVAERTSAGRFAHYPYGLERLGELDSNRLFYLTDGFNSVVGMLDEQGRLIDTYSYDPFGKSRETFVQLSHGPSSPFRQAHYQIQATQSQDQYDLRFGWLGQKTDPEVYKNGFLGLLNKLSFAAMGRVGDYMQRNFDPFYRLAGKPISAYASYMKFGDWRYKIGAGVGKALSTVHKTLNYANAAQWGFKANDAWQNKQYYTAVFRAIRPLVSKASVDVTVVGLGGAAAFSGGSALAVAVPVLGFTSWLTSELLEIGEVWMGVLDVNRWTYNNIRLHVKILKERGADSVEIFHSLSKSGVPENQRHKYVSTSPYTGGALATFRPPGSQQFNSLGSARLPSGSVGGISLDGVAEVLVDLNDLSGAVFDPQSGQLILTGKKDQSLPAMDLDDLVVAIRSIYSGQEPSMSIEPCRPGTEDGCLKVLYNGRFQHPDHPNWGWVSFDPIGGVVQTDPPVSFGTHFGWTLFESDRYLKVASLGRDNIDPDKLFSTNVPGFTSELDRMAASRSPNSSSESGCLIRTEADRQRPSSCHRLWFVPGEITMTVSEDGNSLVFEPATIVTEARFVRHDKDGRMVDVPGNDPAVDAFVDDFNTYYGDIAEEKKEFRELIQIAKIVGLVRWLYDNNVPVDLWWIDRHEVAKVETPLRTPAIKATSGTVSLYGGVRFPPENITYRTDDIVARRLATDALEVRQSRNELSWTFSHESDSLEARALNLAPGLIVGGYAPSSTDAAVDVAGKLVADFSRQFNSVDLNDGSLGIGWSHVTPFLSFRRVRSSDDPEANGTKGIVKLGMDRLSFPLLNDGFFVPEDAASQYKLMGPTAKDRFDPIPLTRYVLQPSLPGRPPIIRDEQGVPIDYTGFALVFRDGYVQAFSPSGRLVGSRDLSGDELTYIYENDRLTSIHDSADRGLWLTYDVDDRVARLTTSDGDEVHYAYTAGYLTELSDEDGAKLIGYGYDTQGRLSRITDKNDRVVQELTYDALGRVLTSGSGPSSMSRVVYDDVTNTVTYWDSGGGAFVYRYDKNNRLIGETDPYGNTRHYGYDRDGNLISTIDPKGNESTYKFNPNGLLAEVSAADGGRTRMLNYTESGAPQLVVGPDSSITRYTYDELGRLTGMETGLQLSELNADGSIRYFDQSAVSVATEYDDDGNISSVRDPNGYSTSFTHDEDGNVTGVHFPIGEDHTVSYDEAGRVRSSVDPSGYQVEYTYTDDGRMASVTDPAGETRYEYEEDGLLAAITDPLNNTVRYTYDEEGRLHEEIAADGSTTTYSHNADGNLAEVVNPAGQRTAYDYDALGRVTAVSYTMLDDPGFEFEWTKRNLIILVLFLVLVTIGTLAAWNVLIRARRR